MSAPRFKVGDFIAGPQSVFMLIVSVIDGDPTLYAVSHIKQSDHLHWLTESEIVDHGYQVGEPPFVAFESLKVGDIIAMDDQTHVMVLARVGHAVLLSQAPDGAAGFILDMTRTMTEQGAPPIMPDGAKEQLRDAASMNKAYRRAGMWHDIRTLALFNWRIVRDEY
jgi:hypothetical protein